MVQSFLLHFRGCVPDKHLKWLTVSRCKEPGFKHSAQAAWQACHNPTHKHAVSSVWQGCHGALLPTTTSSDSLFSSVSSILRSPHQRHLPFAFSSLHPACRLSLNALSLSPSIYFMVRVSTSLCPFQLFFSPIPSSFPLFDQVCSRRQTRRSLSERCSCVNKRICVHVYVCTRNCWYLRAWLCCVCMCVCVCVCVCFKHAWAKPWGQSSFVLPTISQRWMCLQGIGLRRKAPPARSY